MKRFTKMAILGLTMIVAIPALVFAQDDRKSLNSDNSVTGTSGSAQTANLGQKPRSLSEQAPSGYNKPNKTLKQIHSKSATGSNIGSSNSSKKIASSGSTVGAMKGRNTSKSKTKNPSVSPASGK